MGERLRIAGLSVTIVAAQQECKTLSRHKTTESLLLVLGARGKLLDEGVQNWCAATKGMCVVGGGE